MLNIIKNKSGFTLIELIIALLLLSIVSLSVSKLLVVFVPSTKKAANAHKIFNISRNFAACYAAYKNPATCSYILNIYNKYTPEELIIVNDLSTTNQPNYLKNFEIIWGKQKYTLQIIVLQ